MLLNLNLPLPPSCSVTVHFKHAGPAYRWADGGSGGAGCAVSSRPQLAWFPQERWGVSWGALSSRQWEEGLNTLDLPLGSRFYHWAEATGQSLPLVWHKCNCDDFHKAKPGICRCSVCLPALLINPRTIPAGSMLDCINLFKRLQSEL